MQKLPKFRTILVPLLGDLSASTLGFHVFVAAPCTPPHLIVLTSSPKPPTSCPLAFPPSKQSPCSCSSTLPLASSRSACCSGNRPMFDGFWSFWQAQRYPARSTQPPCIFLPAPLQGAPVQYHDFDTMPPKRPGSARVVFVSDTHGRHASMRVPPGDVLCHCGDIMFMGGKFSPSYCDAQYAAFDAWMVLASPPPPPLPAAAAAPDVSDFAICTHDVTLPNRRSSPVPAESSSPAITTSICRQSPPSLPRPPCA